jgi:hypothetical protein
MRILLLAATLLVLSPQDKLIDRAAFMKGCWERRAGTRLVEEQWMAPRGGMMLGMARTVRGDTLVEYEQVRIFERNGRLVYAAQPSRQAPAEFESTSFESNSIVFANPAHDFPQRISYRSSGDSLFARVEGTMNGQKRGVDFRYARVVCS